MITPEEIAASLDDLLLDHSRQDRTNAIKEVFRNLAEKHRFIHHASGVAGRRELLYDVVWTDAQVFRGYFKYLPLICEIELTANMQTLAEDFRKLLMARCKLKVFIMCLGAENHHRTTLRFPQAINEFRRVIAGYSHATDDEIYMFYNFRQNGQYEIVSALDKYFVEETNYNWLDYEWWENGCRHPWEF